MTIDSSILTGARDAPHDAVFHADQAASGADLPQPLKREIACAPVVAGVL